MGLHLGLALGNAQPVGPASSITIDTAPAITGTAEVGETLTRTVGSYSGDGTITVSNGRWTRNGVDISPAQTGASYTLDPADDETTVRWYEDVADAGSGDTITAQSNGLYVTYAAPVEDAAPTASGDAVIGESLTGTSGTFTGSNLTEGDEWEVSDDGTTGWTGTGDTDTTSPAQVSGKHYRFASTASNSGGTLATYSSVIGPAIAPTITMAGLSGGEAVEGSHASITMSANIGTITARKWGSTSGGSQYGTGTNPTDFTGGTTLYATATVGGVDYTTFATIAEDTTPALSATLDSEMEIDGSGDISLTVTAPSDYAGGPYTTDQSTAATGNLNTASIETGPQCAVVPAISRTSGASDTVGAVYTRVSGLWLYDGDDTLTLAGEWYLDGVATGETGATYTSDTAGDVDWRDSASGAGATRTAISNEITVAAADVTAPILSSPTAAKDGETGATSLGVSTNEGNGTLYWGIYPTASTPSAADVVAGTGATVNGSQAVSGTGVQSVSDQTGLTAGTAYKAHYVQDDAATNRSSVATSSEFTTDAAASDPAGDILTLLGADVVGLQDGTDWSNMWQDTAGTTAVTAAGQAVRRIDDLSGNGNHWLATSGNAISQSGYLDFNDAKFQISGALSGGETGMEVYALIDPADDGDDFWLLLGRASLTGFFAGVAQSGGSGAMSDGFTGTRTNVVDNVVGTQTRPALYTDMAAGGYKAQGIRDIVLTAGLTNLLPLGYESGVDFGGRMKLFLFAKTLTTGERSSLQTIFDGAK